MSSVISVFLQLTTEYLVFSLHVLLLQRACVCSLRGVDRVECIVCDTV